VEMWILGFIVSLLGCLGVVQSGSVSFYVADGNIYDQNGKFYRAKGINLGDPNIADDVLRLFPGINFIRFASGEMNPASYYQNFVNRMTSAGVVTEIEWHPWPLINASVRSDEANWYASLAKAFMNNPYVWFGTMNEPQGGDITGEQVNVYNAIRNTGSDTMLLMEAGVGAGNPGQTGPAVLNPSAYSGMYNVAWDLHYYGWVTGYSTDQNTVNAKLLGCVGCGTGILSAQEITSKSGKIPVLNAEFGVSTTGESFDANQNQDVYAVTVWAMQNNYTRGFSGWHWDADPCNALQKNGQLTNWGKELANAIQTTS